jgi:hypothetical protein
MSARRSGRNTSPICVLIVAIICVLAGFTGTAQAQGSGSSGQPQIWFSPRPDSGDHAGAVDFMELFQPNAPWSETASAISAFVLYTPFVQEASDAQLTTIIRFLQQHHIALAVNQGILERPARDAGCGHSEGYTNIRGNLERLKALGGTVAYLNADEPLWFGHARRAAGACQTPIRELAATAARSARTIQSIFPDIKIGEVEPITNWRNPEEMIADVREWLDALQSGYGRPMAFFGLDIGWRAERRPWQPGVTAIIPELRRRNIPVLAIYNGDSNRNLENSDAAWISQAQSHAQSFEGLVGRPDIIKFQSWVRWPSHLLPENQPGTFTNLILGYIHAHSR